MPRLPSFLLLAAAAAAALVAPAAAAGGPDFLEKAPLSKLGDCHGEWFACVKSEPCADSMKAVYGCMLDKKDGPSACLAGLAFNVSALPAWKDLDSCLKKGNSSYAGVQVKTDIPGVPPSAVSR